MYIKKQLILPIFRKVHNYCFYNNAIQYFMQLLITSSFFTFRLYCFICLPYCIGSCMNTAHYCGMCDRYLGTYVRE